MKRFSALILVSLLSITSHAVSKEEADKILKEDMARWVNAKTYTLQFVAPPAGWKRIHDADLHFSLYFPCDAEKRPGEPIQYACVIDHTSYAITVSPGDFRDAGNIAANEAGVTYQIHKRFLDAYGAPVFITPEMRINYAGTTGRQEMIISPKVSTEMRNVYSANLAISMGIGASTGKLPKDHLVFFNTLQLDGAP